MATAEPGEHNTSTDLAAGSNILSEFTCQPCSVDNAYLEAVGFCVNCSEYLCDECFRYHLKPPLTRHHKLIDIEEAKKDNTSISNTACGDVCTEKCPKHPREIIKYYCSDHDIVGCGKCVTENHKKCKGIKNIADIAKDASDEYSAVMQELDGVVWKSIRSTRISVDNKAKSRSNCDKVAEDVMKTKNEVTHAFENLEKEMESESEAITQKDTQKMDDNIAMFDDIKSKAETLATNLKGLRDSGQYCKLFTALKTEKKGAKLLASTLDKAAGDNDVTDYSFQLNKRLETAIHDDDGLGKLSKNKHEKSITTTPEKPDETKKETHTKVTKMSKIYVKTGTDTETCLIGLVSLPRDRIVAADNHNKSIKLIDVKSAKVIDVLRVPGKPWDVTATDDPDEIAVTFKEKRKLVIVKVVGDSLVTDREINMANVGYGITFTKGTFVTSGTAPEKLKIIDKTGKTLRKVIENERGQSLFEDVASLSVSEDGEFVYVPDREKNVMICLTLSGKVRAVYRDEQLKRARCVTVDKKGMVYVGGQHSKNIHQITKDFKKVRILLTEKDGLRSPRCLCYNTERDWIYIGEDTNNILVYQLP